MICRDHEGVKQRNRVVVKTRFLARTVQFSENACRCEESSTKQSRVTGEIASQSLAMTLSFREN